MASNELKNIGNSRLFDAKTETLPLIFLPHRLSFFEFQNLIRNSRNCAQSEVSSILQHCPSSIMLRCKKLSETAVLPVRGSVFAAGIAFHYIYHWRRGDANMIMFEQFRL